MAKIVSARIYALGVKAYSHHGTKNQSGISKTSINHSAHLKDHRARRCCRFEGIFCFWVLVRFTNHRGI